MSGIGVSTLRMVVLYLPLAWVGGRLLGVYGIFAAAAVSNILAGITAYVWLTRTARKASPEDAPTGDRRGADPA